MRTFAMMVWNKYLAGNMGKIHWMPMELKIKLSLRVNCYFIVAVIATPLSASWPRTNHRHLATFTHAFARSPSIYPMPLCKDSAAIWWSYRRVLITTHAFLVRTIVPVAILVASAFLVRRRSPSRWKDWSIYAWVLFSAPVCSVVWCWAW